MWRKARILVLLVILLIVALNTYFDRVYTTDWDFPLRVALYPIAGDNSPATQQFIERLSSERLEPLEKFFATQASQYGVKLEQPIRFQLMSQLSETPPPLDRSSNVFGVMSWSLRMRYWAWQTPEPRGAPPDIKLFIVYHDPAITHTVAHSVGMQKGLYGVVNVFADASMRGSNDVVLAHELLHTLGASDKYSLRDNQPMHPFGYADPDKQPLYPQTRAELMGGRIPLSQTESEIPESLRNVIIGRATALEIRWMK